MGLDGLASWHINLLKSNYKCTVTNLMSLSITERLERFLVHVQGRVGCLYQIQHLLPRSADVESLFSVQLGRRYPQVQEASLTATKFNWVPGV